MSDAEINIHASCVAIGAEGVLLLGPSGAGKSDLALRLIDGGAQAGGRRPHHPVHRQAARFRPGRRASIRGLIEIRGLGIVEAAARAPM